MNSCTPRSRLPPLIGASCSSTETTATAFNMARKPRGITPPQCADTGSAPAPRQDEDAEPVPTPALRAVRPHWRPNAGGANSEVASE